MEKQALRHAWLIMTHGDLPILEKQLRFLDSSRGDFYLHIDKKAGPIDEERLRSIPRRSAVTLLPRRSVSWGHFSQIQCELDLLRAALPEKYDYYHLLSGVDVPIKSRGYIEGYFETRPGVNYLNVEDAAAREGYVDRIRFYYPFQRLNIRNRVLRLALRRLTVALERPFIDRTKALPPGTVIQKGANWFSITHSLAEYVLSREEEIRRVFRSTSCGDEIFMQTLVANSDFRDTLPSDLCGLDHRNCLRYIDWYRGKPYVFTDGDYEELIAAPEPYLFARKFSYRDAPGVVDALFEHFGGPEGGDDTP